MTTEHDSKVYDGDALLYARALDEWRPEPHGAVGLVQFGRVELAENLLVALIGVIALAAAM